MDIMTLTLKTKKLYINMYIVLHICVTHICSYTYKFKKFIKNSKAHMIEFWLKIPKLQQ